MWVPLPPAPEQERLVMGLELFIGFIEEVAAVSSGVREASADLLKTLGEGRALSFTGHGAAQPAEYPSGSGVEG